MAKDADIMVRVGGDTIQLQNSMSKASKSVSKFGKNTENAIEKSTKAMKSLALIGSAAFAGAATIVVKATIEQEKAIAQLESAMKSTGNQASLTSKQYQDMAANLQNLSTFGDEAIISSQALLLTFTKVGSDTFPRAQKAILDTATAMGTDLKSATIQVGKALNDPILGMSALSRSGIQFTKEQKLLVKQLVETDKAVEAQAIILKELETQFGGSAMAARDTFGGALKSLKNAAGDLIESDGLGGVTSSINQLTETLQSPDVKEGFQDMISGILKIIELGSKGAAAIAELSKAIGEGAAKAVYGPILTENLEALNLTIRKSQKELDILREKQEKYAAVAGKPSKQLQDDIDSQAKKVKELWNIWGSFHSENIKIQQEEVTNNTKTTDVVVNNVEKQIAATEALVQQQEKVKELLSEPLPESGLFQDPEAAMGEGGEEFKERHQEYLNQLAERLEALREANKTESEVEAEKYAQDLEALKLNFENQLLSEEEYYSLREAAKQSHEDRMMSITDLSNKTQQQMVIGSLMDMLGSLATHNKKAFEMNKKAKKAQAIVSGVSSAISAWEAGMSTGGPWAPAVAAAYTVASIAKTASLISSIDSASYSGGGGSVSGGGSSVPSVATGGGQDSQEPSRIVNVSFQGGDYERQLAGGIINVISEEIKRGGVIEGVQMT